MVSDDLDPAAGLGRRDRRSHATRQALLESGREVFVEVGYEGAHKSEILRRANVSNGSLYHHFGGKPELFVSLFDDMSRRREQRSTDAVLRMRATGVDDPAVLYLELCRAYMDACWDERDLTILFASGEGPAEFATVRESLLERWIHRNANIVGRAPESPLVHAMTAVMAEAGRLVARSSDQSEAHRVRDDFLAIITRMMADSAAG